MYFLRHRSHLHRYRQIASTLTHHGPGFLVSAFGLECLVPLPKGMLGRSHRARGYSRPERLRMAFEDLGATFIKLGQILSTRPDLLPPDYLAELARLQDQAPPVPRTVIEETLRFHDCCAAGNVACLEHSSPRTQMICYHCHTPLD